MMGLFHSVQAHPETNWWGARLLPLTLACPQCVSRNEGICGAVAYLSMSASFSTAAVFVRMSEWRYLAVV